ncbi:hypothetical protein D3C85_1603390 [compost metagenome]
MNNFQNSLYFHDPLSNTDLIRVSPIESEDLVMSAYCNMVFWVVHINSRQYVTWRETFEEAQKYIGDNPWLTIVKEDSDEHHRDMQNGIPPVE